MPSRTALMDSIDESISSNSAPIARGGNATISGVSPSLFWANTLVAGIAVAIACWSVVQLQETERETRMLEYYVMELDGKLMRSGVIEADRSWSARKQERK